MSFSATTKHKFTNFLTKKWRHDIQHNDTELNDTQHNDIYQNNTKHNDIQHNDTHHNDIHQNNTQQMTLSITTFTKITLSIMTLSIMTFSTMALSIKGVFVTLSINGTQHNNTVTLLGVFMLSVAFHLLLCYVTLY